MSLEVVTKNSSTEQPLFVDNKHIENNQGKLELTNKSSQVQPYTLREGFMESAIAITGIWIAFITLDNVIKPAFEAVSQKIEEVIDHVSENSEFFEKAMPYVRLTGWVGINAAVAYKAFKPVSTELPKHLKNEELTESRRNELINRHITKQNAIKSRAFTLLPIAIMGLVAQLYMNYGKQSICMLNGTEVSCEDAQKIMDQAESI